MKNPPLKAFSFTASLGSFAALNIALGFVNQWIILTIIGPGADTDAHYASIVLPGLVLTVTTTSLSYVLIPILSSARDQESFLRVSWSSIQVFLVLFLLIATPLFLTSRYWITVAFPGFDPGVLSLVNILVKIQVINMILTAVNSVQMSVCHAKKRFLRVEYAYITANIVGIFINYWGLPTYGIVLAAVVAVLKNVIVYCWLTPSYSTYRFPDLQMPEISQIRKRVAPLLAGSLYYRSDVLIDRFLASLASPGSISLWHLAQQIYNAAVSVLSKSISAPMVPMLSNLSLSADAKTIKRIYRNRLLVVFAIQVLATLVLLLAGKFVFDALFGYKNFTYESVVQLWYLCVALLGFFFSGAMGQVLTSTFYSFGETKIPTAVGMTGYTIGIGLKIAGFYLYGIAGLAVGTSVYYMINLLGYYVFLQRFLARRARTGDRSGG